MKAILLAAGLGSRMGEITKGNHKSMLEVGGKTIIQHEIESLVRAGIRDIVVVTGYCSEQLKQHLGKNYKGAQIIYVDNNEYENRGNLYSLYLAKYHLSEGFIAMDADLIFDSRIIKELLDSAYANALLIGPLDKYCDEEIKVYSKDGTRVAKLGKFVNLDEGDILQGEAVGMVKYSKQIIPEYIQAMERMINENNRAEREDLTQYFASQGMVNFVKTDKKWIEIDFPEDIEKARNVVYPAIISEETGREQILENENKSNQQPRREFKVLLIHANSTLDTLIPPNLSVMAAVLKKAGVKVELFDTTFYKTREFTGDDARVRTLQVKETNFEDLNIYLYETDMYGDFIKKVEEYKPDLVGLSAVELTYPFGIKFLGELRERGFTIPTIVGGIHATLSPEEVLKEYCVDYVCVGEGEYALKELCEALRDYKPTTGILNIWQKKGDYILKNPVRPPVDLNEIPFQDWEMFDKKRLYKPMGGKIRRTGCFELNRGCPYSCTYCCNEFLHKMYKFKHYRERNVRRFIDEIKFMKEKYGLEYIYVSAESLLSTTEERFKEFIRLWKEEIKLPFWAETRPESVTLERAKLLEEAGCVSMSVGLESGSSEIRKMLNRHMSNERIIQAFRDLKDTDLRICANSIIGFPDETREQVFETIELNRAINADNIMIHVFNPYHGTQLFDYCVKKGYIPKETLGGDYRADAMLKMPQLSQQEILGLQRTFAMYVKFSKEMWPEIKIAEKFDKGGNEKFDELSKLYREKYLQ